MRVSPFYAAFAMGSHPSFISTSRLHRSIKKDGYGLITAPQVDKLGVWHDLLKVSGGEPMEIDLTRKKVLSPNIKPFPELHGDIGGYLLWLERSFPSGPFKKYHHFLKVILKGSRKGQADIWHQDGSSFLTFSRCFYGRGTQLALDARNQHDAGRRILEAKTQDVLVFPGGKSKGAYGDFLGIHRSPPYGGDRVVVVSYLEKA